MSTKTLHDTHQVLLMLSSVGYLTTVLFNHRGQVCEVTEYMTSTEEDRYVQKGSETVLADQSGQVYRIRILMSPDLEGPVCKLNPFWVNENINFKTIKPVKTTNENHPKTLISVDFSCMKMRKQTTFVICGKYLCWYEMGSLQIYRHELKPLAADSDLTWDS